MRIKLIASDMDGTLLLNGCRQVSNEQLAVIEDLINQGILFAPASGRQYTNLRNNFKPVMDKLIYICENGGLVKYKGETLYKASIERQLGLDIMQDIYERENCEVLLSGEETSYLLPKSDEYVDYMINSVKNKVTVIKDFNDVKEDFIKISVYCSDGIDLHSEYFHNRWSGLTQDTVSGQCWQDFVPVGVHKGKALSLIQSKFNINKEETMCFGDNYNDIEMFETAYHSFAMCHSAKAVLQKARFRAVTVEDTLKSWQENNLYEW